MPRWSVVSSGQAPLSVAALPAKGSCVRVGPPLSWSAVMNRAVLVRSLVAAKGQLASLTMLCPPDVTAPEQLPWPRATDMIELRTVVSDPVVSCANVVPVLFTNVLLAIVVVPPEKVGETDARPFATAPPALIPSPPSWPLSASLPENVLAAIDADPASLNSPPPHPNA
jgi:hypothetical protein